MSASNSSNDDTSNNSENETNETNENQTSSSSSNLPSNLRQRMRSVAEREASRLARPDRPPQETLGHASRLKSAVSSCPSGIGTFQRTATGAGGGARSTKGTKGTKGNGSSSNSQDPSTTDQQQQQQWCGPFSVARQMIAAREEARKKREVELQQQQEEERREKHPLDAIVRELDLEQKKRANPSLTWRSKVHINNTGTVANTNGDGKGKGKGKQDNLYYKRQKRYRQQNSQNDDADSSTTTNMNTSTTATTRINKIPSLFNLCIQFIVQNFPSVEALGPMVDSHIRTQICHHLVSNGTFNGAAFDTLAEEGIETLEITDCTQVTQEQMVEALEKLMMGGLRALILTHCGRCFGKGAVDAIVNSIRSTSIEPETEPKLMPMPKDQQCDPEQQSEQQPELDQQWGFDQGCALFAVSISGAYLLKDVDAARLVERAKGSLSSIEFKQCQLLGKDLCTCISTHFSSSQEVVANCNGNGNVNGNANALLELSFQDVPLTASNFQTLASTNALRNLQSLSLCQMDSLHDTTLFQILHATNGNLENINITNDIHLTDETLSSIRRCNSKGRLKSLKLGGIKNFSAAGLEAFFTFGIEGLPQPPVLRVLDLSHGDFDAVNEVVVGLAIRASALKQTAEIVDWDTLQSQTTNGTTAKVTTAARTSKARNSELLSALGGLASLDISGSSVTDKNMEELSIFCNSTLTELKINFCPHVSDSGLGYLVSKCGNQLTTLEIWGNAQISDVFLDGHDRVLGTGSGRGLAIEGAWMKQSSGIGSQR